MRSTRAARRPYWRVWRQTRGCGRVVKSCEEPVAARHLLRHLAPAGSARSSAGRAPPAERIRPRRTRFAGIAFRELAAGLVIGALAAGAALWAASSFGLFDGQEDWRTAITEYTHLYTNETFGPLKPDVAQQAAELKVVDSAVGTNLTPESIALPGLRFASAFMLSYEGSPMGVIAYVDPSGAPVLYCILANGASDAPTKSGRRGDLSLAWWSSDGRSHLVIGRIPQETAVAAARTLAKRV